MGVKLRSVGLARAKAEIRLANIACNIRCFVLHRRKDKGPGMIRSGERSKRRRDTRQPAAGAPLGSSPPNRAADLRDACRVCRSIHDTPVNQINLTRRVRSEEPRNAAERDEEAKRFARAVLLAGAPLPDAEDSRYRARIYRGMAITV